MKRFAIVLACILALATLPALAPAEETMTAEEMPFGAAAVAEGVSYTLEEMLTYALQDEYLAKAEYELIQEVFGVDNPFGNIMKAEITHQELLFGLFEAYGFAIPEDTAKDHVIIPDTLLDTYLTGVEAEIKNIAMYLIFLSDDTLPQDVRDGFTALMNASQSHLEAFSRNAEKFAP